MWVAVWVECAHCDGSFEDGFWDALSDDDAGEARSVPSSIISEGLFFWVFFFVFFFVLLFLLRLPRKHYIPYI